MRTFQAAIIGGGASGIAAAISAARSGCRVLICEKTARIGRKILASGNGRCNLSNEKLEERFYNCRSRDLVRSVLKKTGSQKIRSFFEGLGLHLASEDGRMYPATNQSSSVLKVLEMELSRLKIDIELCFDVSSVSRRDGSYMLTSKGGKSVEARSVILACGGKSYPAFGSDGSGYRLAQKLGHTIVDPVPASVPLVVKDRLCHILQGQKICANVSAIINGSRAGRSSGDLLFTKYGLSGTAVLDVSEAVSEAINRNRARNVTLEVDMVPFMDNKQLAVELQKRLRRNLPPEEIAVGILPNKFGHVLADIVRTHKPGVEDMVRALKGRIFHVLQTRGWNEAEFTSGGVVTTEIDAESLESTIKKRAFFAGEMLDVDGLHGGYNLAWAWASGMIAGESASCVK